MKVQIMDTTLRDGEQTSGVAFTKSEKLNIAQLLLGELKVDRVEVASARVSQGEFEGAKAIIDWAKEKGHIDKVEILSFIDGGQSIDWISSVGGKVANLLSKGSHKHVTQQLKQSPEEHLAAIKETIHYADSKGIACNIYLEDWSNGMRQSKDYVFFMLDSLKNEPIKRFMLPDTLGILQPQETFDFCSEVISRYPELNFDFHPHNDYDLGTANVFFAVKAGITGIHSTINGLGERAGNVPLSSIIATLNDHLKCDLNINEEKVNLVSRMVETFSGIRIPENKPVVGENVFTQTCGVHADGDSKDNLYYNELLPERFGRVRKYALGKTSGKANIKKNLEDLGIELDQDAMRKVTDRIIELGDKKEYVTPEDLPFIISDVLRERRIEDKIKIVNYSVVHTMGLQSVATVAIEIEGKVYEETATGDGQYDAYMNALKRIYGNLGKEVPPLVDYIVIIPPGGKTDALVEALITWDVDGKQLKTRGLDPDQTQAAIKATTRMLNILENGALANYF